MKHLEPSDNVAIQMNFTNASKIALPVKEVPEEDKNVFVARSDIETLNNFGKNQVTQGAQTPIGLSR